MREQIRRARALRRAATQEEQLLWAALRGRSMGYPIRRQHPFGRRIFDFYCPAARLAIEIDRRDDNALTVDDNDYWTRKAGIEVLRFKDAEVNENVFAVLERIKREIDRGVVERQMVKH
jgi:very-short-patch-repair endonuclease